MSAVKILLYLFIVIFDKNPASLREFASIEGRWTVVRAENHGKTAAPHRFGDHVEFFSSNKAPKQMPDTVAFSGKLKPGQSPNQLDISTITIMLTPRPRATGPPGAAPDPKQPPSAPVESIHPHKAIAIYQVTANTMKILVMPQSTSEPLLPKRFVTTEAGNEFLLELKREPKHTGSGKQN